MGQSGVRAMDLALPLALAAVFGLMGWFVSKVMAWEREEDAWDKA